jgi:hypothetical protein
MFLYGNIVLLKKQMSILGIDEITFGSKNIGKCRQFFLDWGLELVSESEEKLVFQSLNACRVIVAHSDSPGLPSGIEPDPTLRQVVWGVESESDLAAYSAAMSHLPDFKASEKSIACKDPSGLSFRLQVNQKKKIDLACAENNTWSDRRRINHPSPAYDRAQPIEVGHVVMFVKELEKVSNGFFIATNYACWNTGKNAAPKHLENSEDLELDRHSWSQERIRLFACPSIMTNPSQNVVEECCWNSKVLSEIAPVDGAHIVVQPSFYHRPPMIVLVVLPFKHAACSEFLVAAAMVDENRSSGRRRYRQISSKGGSNIANAFGRN